MHSAFIALIPRQQYNPQTARFSAQTGLLYIYNSHCKISAPNLAASGNLLCTKLATIMIFSSMIISGVVVFVCTRCICIPFCKCNFLAVKGERAARCSNSRVRHVNQTWRGKIIIIYSSLSLTFFAAEHTEKQLGAKTALNGIW